MAASPPDARAALLLALLLTASHGTQAASPRSAVRGAAAAERVLNIDAARSEIDYQSHHLLMSDVKISQGPVRIEAREAEADSAELSFNGSHWEFRGDVRIQFEDGRLEAESATVSFVGNRIQRARATGSPATFEQKLQKQTEPARGRAGSIDYDVAGGVLALSQGTWFTDGRNEWRSDALTYSVRERRLQSGGQAASAPGQAPEGGGRIHITVRPDEDAPPAAAEPGAQ